MTEHGERLDIDGAALELVRLPGAQPGPTIIFLHEGLGSAALWKDAPARVVELTGLSAVAAAVMAARIPTIALLAARDDE